LNPAPPAGVICTSGPNLLAATSWTLPACDLDTISLEASASLDDSRFFCCKASLITFGPDHPLESIFENQVFNGVTIFCPKFLQTDFMKLANKTSGRKFRTPGASPTPDFTTMYNARQELF
jgi:hypothetical protein